ncbi:sensor histidine kinase [Sinorhizobium terangae]|uniref:histidine kinase n=1 Tax=Sinorhizobium terangae TaxID=110322 RepID=A0A6N7LM72_SINTE|nr:HAMP domain-containing sensor histidine kinase [Sinorhizobium terangae]MBB4183604.1 signal transduction histidine kinase [Sinorhizobium terangae]MQX18736.1 sensor histidine kinase [Sinorhizobium terangae]WFU47758.1 HAMP domain-containing sensor histidine kinase [Sinorhizobium terangae]
MMRSLRLRLAIGAMIAIAFVLLMAWISLSRLFTDYVLKQYRAEMTSIIDTIAAETTASGGGLQLEREPADPRFRLPTGGRYWQISPASGEPQRSRSLWDVVIDTDSPPVHAYQGFAQVEGPDGSPMLVHSEHLSLGDGPAAVSFTAYAGFSRKELDDALGAFHDRMRLMLLAMAGVLAGAAFLQGAIGLMPLQRLRQRAAAVRAGRESDFGTAGPSEVQPLVSEINMLLAERESALERARARASDLAHGLKTPLTVLAHLAEHLPPDERAAALQQVDAVRQRADRQLQAARMGVERMAATTVAELGTRVVNVLRPVTVEKGIAWEVDIEPALSLDIDPADFAECIGNLLDNASKWARSRIRLGARNAEDCVVIEIDDDGPGVDDKNRELVLRRGAHLDDHGPEQRSGSGLGLAISADIAEAYGATLRLARSPLGGLQAALIFPRR